MQFTDYEYCHRRPRSGCYSSAFANSGNLLPLAFWGFYVQVSGSSARCLRVRFRRNTHNDSFGKIPSNSQANDDKDFSVHHQGCDLCNMVQLLFCLSAPHRSDFSN
ncbi:hypothetical protein OS493_035405 [Desmophyllum pertusum]|uniref:Uncharacterized protein n=1 Tax=Desmophyllum pertusum TaxID=174260 RepID=A0A9W9ZW59_9CNID|nr:hypothetical protein OS493_035405 [Desmophyllum pertusum]